MAGDVELHVAAFAFDDRGLRIAVVEKAVLVEESLEMPCGNDGTRLFFVLPQNAA